VPLANQNDPDAGAALVAVVRSGAVLIIEPEPIFPAAERTGPMLVAQEPSVDAELRQDFEPAVAGSLNGAVADHAAPASHAWMAPRLAFPIR
jgi:hypothetical protein